MPRNKKAIIFGFLRPRVCTGHTALICTYRNTVHYRTSLHKLCFNSDLVVLLLKQLSECKNIHTYSPYNQTFCFSQLSLILNLANYTHIHTLLTTINLYTRMSVYPELHIYYVCTMHMYLHILSSMSPPPVTSRFTVVTGDLSPPCNNTHTPQITFSKHSHFLDT